jgi:hypothetical protein
MNTNEGNYQTDLTLFVMLSIVLLVLTGLGIIVARLIGHKNSLDVVAAMAVAVSPAALVVLHWFMR